MQFKGYKNIYTSAFRLKGTRKSFLLTPLNLWRWIKIRKKCICVIQKRILTCWEMKLQFVLQYSHFCHHKLCICPVFPSPASLKLADPRQNWFILGWNRYRNKSLGYCLKFSELRSFLGVAAQEWEGIRQRMALDAHNPHPVSNRIHYSQIFIFQPGVMLGSASSRFCVVSLSSWSFLPSLGVGRSGGFVT